ncbi:unnamed protein product [Meloidogyne enterolobii]|uniref:Uncharacterized protein n=1 Tax=Meloidogyne enterolobii TaxID=390850 RepID=A0ACB0YWX4_MELEN
MRVHSSFVTSSISEPIASLTGTLESVVNFLIDFFIFLQAQPSVVYSRSFRT